MSRPDLDTALAWAAAEGWNPGSADGDCFWAADPAGFLMGWLDGEPVGCISAVSYGPDFGFVGLYIVTAPERGKGYGFQLWQAGLDMLGNRTVGLDGVVAQQANYASQGFSLAHRNIRYGGRAGSAPATTGAGEGRVVRITAALGQEVAALDRACFPGFRESFLRCWTEAPRKALAFVGDNRLRGYGVIRAARAGCRIGPLLSDSAEVAETLFAALVAEADGAEIFIDVPEPNAAARGMVQRHGLSPVFETARMYRGSDPRLPLQRIFAVATLELG